MQLKCQQFHNLFTQFEEYADQAESVFQHALATGQFQEFQVDAAEKHRESMMNAYEEEVRQIITQWLPMGPRNESRDAVLKSIRVTPGGRVILGGDADDKLIIGANFRYFPALIQKIDGLNISLRAEDLETIDHLEEITGRLALSSMRKLRSMRSLRKTGSIYMSGDTPIECFEALEETGSIALERAAEDGNGPITDFPKLKTIRHHLMLGQDTVGRYPELEFIGGNLLLSHEPTVPSFQKLREVHGELDMRYQTKMQSFSQVFPSLQYVGKTGSEISIRCANPSQFEAVNLLIRHGLLRCTGRVVIGRS